MSKRISKLYNVNYKLFWNMHLITPFHKIEEKKGTPTFEPKALLLRSEAVVVVVKVKV